MKRIKEHIQRTGISNFESALQSFGKCYVVRRAEIVDIPRRHPVKMYVWGPIFLKMLFSPRELVWIMNTRYNSSAVHLLLDLPFPNTPSFEIIIFLYLNVLLEWGLIYAGCGSVSYRNLSSAESFTLLNSWSRANMNYTGKSIRRIGRTPIGSRGNGRSSAICMISACRVAGISKYPSTSLLDHSVPSAPKSSAKRKSSNRTSKVSEHCSTIVDHDFVGNGGGCLVFGASEQTYWPTLPALKALL